MTWAEVSDALDYVYRYDITELHAKGSVKINQWPRRGADTLADDLKKATAKMRKGN